jgi:hypothetical protein
VDTAAKNLDPKGHTGQQCEANFYLGEYLLLGKNLNAAKVSFVEATISDVKRYYVWCAAYSEYHRLDEIGISFAPDNNNRKRLIQLLARTLGTRNLH